MTWCFKLNFQLPQGELLFVEKWPLMNSNELIFILVTYLTFVFQIGPYVMEKRNPFRLNNFLVLYNICKVMNSSYLTYKFFTYILENGLFPRTCELNEAFSYIIAMHYWMFMVTKVVDLLDTCIFVLRKKYSQVTFLHVYHHVFMVLISWSCLKYDPSDHWAFMAVLNCGIHAAMYTYYAISALGPSFAGYLWWKKYLTAMQMVQFALIILHLIIQTATSECPMRSSSYWLGLTNTMLFMVLFADFYKKNYNKNNVPQFVCVGHDD